jgi:hypothetical protein
MKKITLILLLFTSFSYAQVKFRTLTEMTQAVTFEQYDLIKKVNEFCPDLLVSKQIKNVYSGKLLEDDKILMESVLVYDLPSDCDFYSVKIIGNSSLVYSYKLKSGVLISGDVRLFAGGVFRTLYKVDGVLSVVQYYINGKLVNELKG